MRMLTIVEWLAVVALAGLEQQRIALVGHGRGIEAQHRSCLKPAAQQVTACHQHRPVERAELLISSWATLLVVLHEPKSMQHDEPRPGHHVSGGEGNGVRNPRGPGTHPFHRNAEWVDHHRHHRLLLGRLWLRVFWVLRKEQRWEKQGCK